MTEYCLVLKSLVDEFLQKKKLNEIKQETSEKEEVYRSTSPQVQFSKPNFIEKNPPLNHIIDLLIDEQYRSYAHGIEKYFGEHSSVKYDEEGNIFRPISGLKMTDVIQFFINGKVPEITRERIKLLNDFVKIPSSFIRNKSARNFLYGENKKRKSLSEISTQPSKQMRPTFNISTPPRGPIAHTAEEDLDSSQRSGRHTRRRTPRVKWTPY